MLLVDKRATVTAKTSLFLTSMEFQEIYPHKLNNRIDYLFKYNQPKEVNNDEAKLLMKKYSHVIKWEEKLELGKTERHEELDKLSIQKLKQVASGLKMTWKEMQGRKPKLINAIAAKEIEIDQIEEKLKEKTE